MESAGEGSGHKRPRPPTTTKKKKQQQGSNNNTEDMDETTLDSADLTPDSEPPATPKSKPKPRKSRRSSSPTLEEDIIDGFAIMAFKTLDDLEVSSRFPSKAILQCTGGDILGSLHSIEGKVTCMNACQFH